MCKEWIIGLVIGFYGDSFSGEKELRYNFFLQTRRGSTTEWNNSQDYFPYRTE